ncbi:MAG TPA: prepilin-type N-terminal cleavage/methylation domain-containing protein [Candidatus Dormibacteraeota bacterium]|nr:prepilin-type N-terminal cleavage/methylation domain-containing protein [Candidatus Dormibacteraeota bacterium]
MPALKLRGFTLVELLVALVLLGIVSTGIYQALTANQRTFIAQTERIGLQQNIRAAAQILPGEFRLLDAGEGDISAMSATQITMRAIRKLGFICLPPTLPGIGNLTMTVRALPFFGGTSSFANNDSLLIFDEGDPTTRNDDSWVAAQVKAAPSAATCPDSGVATQPAGYSVTLAPGWAVSNKNVVGAITNGSPVLGFVSLTYGLFQSASDGRWYVGDSTAGQSWLPIIGPLNGSTGLTLTYYDTLGAVTATPANVASIGIVLRAQTAVPVRQEYQGTTAYQVDSVTTRVALRNNPRCGPPLGPCS